MSGPIARSAERGVGSAARSRRHRCQRDHGPLRSFGCDSHVLRRIDPLLQRLTFVPLRASLSHEVLLGGMPAAPKARAPPRARSAAAGRRRSIERVPPKTESRWFRASMSSIRCRDSWASADATSLGGTRPAANCSRTSPHVRLRTRETLFEHVRSGASRHERPDARATSSRRSA